MRFDRFMELALYSPGLGYYTKPGSTSPVGTLGDFYTSVSAGPLFGRLLARQFHQMWQNLGRPAIFWLIEQGAHDGQLARDILEWCRLETPEFLETIRYGIVDTSGGSSHRHKGGLEADIAPYMSWFDSFEALAAENPVGIFFSNELIDAFPVRAIIYDAGEWMESRVIIRADDTFGWLTRPIEDDELLDAIAALDPPRIEGYSTEVNLRALEWMRVVAQTMQRGYILTIDYGYPAAVYYAPHRIGGTLVAYVRHQAVDDVLFEPGMRDLTAHVDFTSMARTGEAAGLTTLGFLDQQRFLMGIAHDELAGKTDRLAKIQENLGGWNTLTHPDHLGATFFALIQAKDAPGTLECLRFARPGGL